jgi:Protein of unknown function with HXXEE motif
VNFIRRHWYDIGLGLALIVLAWQAFARIEGVQLILLLNLVVLFVHQYEEYHWPGGFPWIFNEVVKRASDGPADRFPLNQNNVAFINITAWAFYLVPVLFPGAIWLGLGQVLFGLVGQVIFHGIVVNFKLKTWYNPGFAAVLLGHVPLGIWYLAEVTGQGAVLWWDWILALVYLGAFMGVVMQLIGFRLLVSATSPYPFTPDEMSRFDRERHLRRAGIVPYALSGEGAPTGAD